MAESNLAVNSIDASKDAAGLKESLFTMLGAIRVLEEIDHADHCECVLCDSAEGMLFTLRMYANLFESEVLRPFTSDDAATQIADMARQLARQV